MVNMDLNKFLFFSFFIFAIEYSTAHKVLPSTTERHVETLDPRKLSTKPESEVLSESNSKPTSPTGSIIADINSPKAGAEISGTETKNSTAEENKATSESEDEENITTNNPNVEVPEILESSTNANVLITENIVDVTTPGSTIETTPIAPRVLTPEEYCHPVIVDFISRIRRVDATSLSANISSTSPIRPTSYFHLRVTDYPKFKYFAEFYRKYLNITDMKIGNRDSSIISAYYAKKDFPTAIDYSKEDSLLIPKADTDSNEPPRRLPFDTKDYYSPKYKNFSKFHYDFFPRYVDGKLVVPVHA